LWTKQSIHTHSLLKNLGPEPLSADFDGAYLKKASAGKQTEIKNFIMDSTVVVGVGNIYANESLFNARIRPTRKAGSVSKARFSLLAEQIKAVLANAINVGGTTLRDFTGSDGKPGYFKQSLKVYGRGGKPCVVCNNTLTEIRIGQRSTVFCKNCQT
jgi:formamidopyrimidine-DNA glycosylase